MCVKTGLEANLPMKATGTSLERRFTPGIADNHPGGADNRAGLSIAPVTLGAVALFTRRHVALGKVRPVRPETSRACWPAAVGDDDREVGDCDRPGGRDHRQPARVVQEHDDGYDEAHHPYTHHHQVAPLTLADLGRAGQVGLGYQISLVTPGAAMASHGSTLGAGVPGS